MSAGYYVAAAMVVAMAEDGTQRYFYQGATVTADIPEVEVERLAADGFLAALPDVEVVLLEVVDNNGPRESWTNDKLAAYAEEHSIDLAGATKKAEMLAAIDKAEQV